ncbi:MAG: HD-GYP domain-containing protein [Candidatus Hydrogenedentota bacterium]
MYTVEVRDAKAGMTLSRPVFTRNGNLLLDAGTRLSDHTLDLLDLWGIFDIQVDSIDSPSGHAPAPRQKKKFDPVKREAEKKRVEDVGGWVRDEIEGLMKQMNSGGRDIDMERLKGVAESIVEESMKDNELMVSLTTLMDFDSYLFSHAVHVSILSVVIGIAMGLTQKEIQSLAIGGALIDLGMLKVDRKIWDKDGVLSEAEFNFVKQHPLLGLKDAEPHCRGDVASLRIIAEHHERLDGSGYPRKLRDKAIHPLAKIVAVCDIYDAMQQPRAYRKKWLPYQVMGHLLVSSTETLDAQVVKTFLRTMSAYPIGSFVKMDTGQVGVVVSSNPASPIRPVVKLFLLASGETMEKPEFADLSADKRFIIGPIDPRQIHVKPFDVF